MSTKNKIENHRGVAVVETETVVLTNREAYLAQHPDERAAQEAFLADLGERIGQMRERIAPVILAVFDQEKNELWIAGEKISNFLDTLPLRGGELTEDFYRQIAFVDKHGQLISRDFLNWLARMARRNPDGNIPTNELFSYWKQLPLYLGMEEQFKLVADNHEKQPVPKKSVDDWLRSLVPGSKKRADEMAQWIGLFQRNPQFGDFSTLKQRRPDLHFEVRTKFLEALRASQNECDLLRESLRELGE